jgi:transposase
MGNNSKPGPKPSVTDDELIAVFQEAEDPVMSTSEVTERVSLTRRSVYDRLASLREEGKLNGKQIGGKNTVWWISDE